MRVALGLPDLSHWADVPVWWREEDGHCWMVPPQDWCPHGPAMDLVPYSSRAPDGTLVTIDRYDRARSMEGIPCGHPMVTRDFFCVMPGPIHDSPHMGMSSELCTQIGMLIVVQLERCEPPRRNFLEFTGTGPTMPENRQP